MKRITILSSLSVVGLLCAIILVFGDEDCDICYTAEAMAGKIFVCGLVVIIGAIYYTKKYRATEDIIFNIENQPLLETNEATADVPFAGEGVVWAPATINSYFSQTPCVYYHAILEKLVKSGKSSHWKIVKNVADYTSFYIQDSRGKIKVDAMNMDDDFSGCKIDFLECSGKHPRNSEIDCEVIFKKEVFKEAVPGLIFSSTVKYRKSEYVLKPGENIFAYGYVIKRDNELVLVEHNNHPLIISQKSRDLYIKEFYKGKNIIYFVYLLIAIGFVLSLYAANYFIRMDGIIFAVILIVGLSVIMASLLTAMYNRIIQLKHRALNALSNIDGEIKRRSDLIPGLVEVVKKYTAYESETQKLIVDLRVKMVKVDTININEKSVFKNIIALMEQYPDLKASKNFKDIFINIVDTEERIAFSRTFYNRAVRKYNVLIQQFPFVLITNLFNFNNMEFIELGRM